MSADLQTAFQPTTKEADNERIKPEMVHVWDEAEFCFLHTLSVRVPLLSESQAIHALKAAGRPHAAAVSCLNRLRENGWLSRFRGTVNWPNLPVEATVCWSPGRPTPKLGRLRTVVRQSTDSAGIRSIRFYVASRWTVNLFGNSYRGTVSTELVTPWLKWAQVYLHLLSEAPEVAPHCDCRTIPSPGEKIGCMPPHLSINADGVPSRIIALLHESRTAGLYALHDYCKQESISYQLW
jgi:hypothetical protein